MVFEAPGVMKLTASKKLAGLPERQMPAAPSRSSARRPAARRARSAEVNAQLYAARDARREKRWADAARSYEKAVELAPEDAAVLGGLAQFLATVEDDAEKDVPRAVELARRGVELTGGEDAPALGVLAEVLREAGELDEAAERAEAAAKLDPSPDVRSRAERFRREADRKRAAAPGGPGPAGPGSDVAGGPTGAPASADGDAETDGPDGGVAWPWALAGVGLAAVVCAAGAALAVRRGRRASG